MFFFTEKQELQKKGLLEKGCYQKKYSINDMKRCLKSKENSGTGLLQKGP